MNLKLPIGLVLVASGLTGFITSARIVKRSRRARGRVVRSLRSTSKHYDDLSSSTSYIPIIVFRPPDGKEFEFRGDSNPREPKVGARVPLQYDPLDPRTAWERRSANIWVLPFLMTAGGVVLVILGLRR